MRLKISSETARGLIVSNYQVLENQLVDCMGYIPYVEANLTVVSPRFVPVLMDACSLIDSILRDSTDRNEKQTLRMYARSLEERLELEESTSILLVSPLQFLRPWHGWTTAAPEWWTAYNLVKHDRIANYPTASYAHTVASVAALHQLLARSWAFLGCLCQSGWFNEGSEAFGDLLGARAAGSGPPDMPVHTHLFVSAIRGELVDWTSGSPAIQNWDFTERVKNYIWEWEGW